MDKELLSAAISGNLRQLARILKLNNRSYDVNTKDSVGRTPLFLAAREGKEEAVQMLLDAGSDVHLRCQKDGDTPLIIACSEGHTGVVSQLLDAGSDVNSPNLNGWTPLIYAAYYNYEEVVRILIEHNADLDRTSQAGCSALYRAALGGKEESVRLLLEAGADANLANSSGNTPLSVASRNGYMSIVKLFLQAGVAVDTVDGDGMTPLHEALDYEKDSVVELLLTLGRADSTIAGPDGRLPVEKVKSDHILRLIESSEQTKRITESLAELQSTQPQLTHLLNAANFDDDIENMDIESTESNSELVSAPNRFSVRLHNKASESETPLTPNSGMMAISAVALSRLTSLAEASPLTIECLKQFGASAVQAELEYERIRKDPTIYEFYLFFIQAVSSAVLASQSIASDMIDDSRLSSAERIMESLDTAASAVSWMGAPILTGIGRILVKIPNVMERQRTIRAITTFFPSIDSHKFIEILARELTIFLSKDIHQIMREAKKASKQSILDKAMRVVEWLQTATNLSVVQGFACGHAARLIDRMMSAERPYPVQLEHIPVLIQWASDKDMVDIEGREHSRPCSPLTPQSTPQSSHARSTAEVTETAAIISVEEQALIDDRIKKLEHRLSMERMQRTALEQKQINELKDLKKQLKGLEAVNNIFSGLNSAGGLVGAQSAESVHKTIEDHLGKQALQQTQQGEILRELVVRVDLLVEDNNLRSPAEIEVPGSGSGSKVYNSNKGTPMGAWVNNKMSYTADYSTPAGGTSNLKTDTSNIGAFTPTNSVKKSKTASSRSNYKYDDIEDADGFVVNTQACCVIS